MLPLSDPLFHVEKLQGGRFVRQAERLDFATADRMARNLAEVETEMSIVRNTRTGILTSAYRRTETGLVAL
ncbi:MAG: hypothetical protein SFU83_23635 [Meiothermus sp.]|nr:hypothetical protein [Meiothermus sp.]